MFPVVVEVGLCMWSNEQSRECTVTAMKKMLFRFIFHLLELQIVKK